MNESTRLTTAGKMAMPQTIHRCTWQIRIAQTVIMIGTRAVNVPSVLVKILRLGEVSFGQEDCSGMKP